MSYQPKSGDRQGIRSLSLYLVCGINFVAERFAAEAGPEQVHEATLAAQLFDVLLEGTYALVGDAKDFEEVDPKGLGLAVFVAGVSPGLGEKQCPGFHFVPVKAHLVLTMWARIVT